MRSHILFQKSRGELFPIVTSALSNLHHRTHGLLCDFFRWLQKEKAAQATTTERLFCQALTPSENLLSHGCSGEQQKNATFSEKSNHFLCAGTIDK
jgi:hypothetical protein